jgi:hypothetical protein
MFLEELSTMGEQENKKRGSLSVKVTKTKDQRELETEGKAC